MICFQNQRMTSLLPLLLSILSAATTTSATNIPSFSLQSLLSGNDLQRQRLHHALTTTGLFQIATPHHFQHAYATLCQCEFDDSGTENERTTKLGDHTRRTTLATMTVGMDHPMAFSDKKCPSMEPLEELRDVVAETSLQVMKALDDYFFLGSNNVLLQDKYGKEYSTLSSISRAANQLEHFHLYQQSNSTTSTTAAAAAALDWHTDAGLFLAFVPARTCGTNDIDTSFWFQDEHGISQQAQFDQNSIVFMMGTGMQHWIQQSSSTFKATRHAVRIPAGQTRAWYGMMHLVPDHAIVQKDSLSTVTFSDLKKSVANDNSTDDVVSMGCGVVSPAQGRYRRLGNANHASECNNSTNFFCWMSCTEIPNVDSLDNYLNNGYSLYCLDPSIEDQDDKTIADAAAPCETGYIHNAACIGQWHLTDDAEGAIPSLTKESEVSTEAQYCYGGTSMYMDGFHWVHDTTCIIYLIPGWVLDGPGKLIVASVGTVAASILLEFTLYWRKSVASSNALLLPTALYGLQLTLGYLLMLVIMTYSGVLFVCVIGGLMLGHAVWNAKHNLWSRYVVKKSTKISYAQGTPSEQTQELEGATPCCMNGMQEAPEEEDVLPECCQPKSEENLHNA
mmetsp:Transcript_30756/g.46637  ORF Transcript_30756/g.46637 Transcript_30756/m.46637 type:complete len:619 (-) Transcript_30756:40-1896(-)